MKIGHLHTKLPGHQGLFGVFIKFLKKLFVFAAYIFNTFYAKVD